MLTIGYCPRCYQRGLHLPPFYLIMYEQLVLRAIEEGIICVQSLNYCAEDILEALEALNFITTTECNRDSDLHIRINGIKKIRDDAFEICLNPFEHNIKFDIYE